MPKSKNDSKSNIGLDPGRSLSLDRDWRAARNFAFMINFVHRLLDRQTKKHLSREHDLTLSEWQVLAFLNRYAPQKVASISKEMAIYKSQASTAVASLERKGLVARRSDPSDGRSPSFTLTAKGKKLEKNVAAWAMRRQSELEAILSISEHRALRNSLHKIATHFQLREGY